MKSALTLLSCLSLALVMSACGNKNGADVSKQIANTNNAGNNPAITSATYTTTCASATIPNLGPIKFPGVKTSFQLSALEFAKIRIYYTDGNCEKVAFTISESGKLDVHGPSQVVGGALDEDFNFEHTTVSVQNNAVLAAFNLAGTCAIKDWAINGTRDVSVQAANITCPGEPSPRTAQEIVLVENGNLFLGAEASKPGRPSQIDRTKVYYKQ